MPAVHEVDLSAVKDRGCDPIARKLQPLIAFASQPPGSPRKCLGWFAVPEPLESHHCGHPPRRRHVSIARREMQRTAEGGHNRPKGCYVSSTVQGFANPSTSGALRDRSPNRDPLARTVNGTRKNFFTCSWHCWSICAFS
jgi:hypothetical protein